MFLSSQQALLEEMRAIKQVSLNEQTRKEETERMEARQLALENQRREAKGLKPLDKLSESQEQDTDPSQDIELLESGRILVDLIEISKTAMADAH